MKDSTKAYYLGGITVIPFIVTLFVLLVDAIMLFSIFEIVIIFFFLVATGVVQLHPRVRHFQKELVKFEKTYVYEKEVS